MVVLVAGLVVELKCGGGVGETCLELVMDVGGMSGRFLFPYCCI